MKKCPICERTFDDSLRFCQTDGTPLVDVSETASDPFKTVVSNQDEISATPADPFKTMVGAPPIRKDEDDILQLPDKNDSLRTQAVSQNEMRDVLSSGGSEKGNVDDFDLAPLEIPGYNEPSLSPPSFGDLSSQESKSQGTSSSDSTLVFNTGSDIVPPRADSSPFSQESSGQSDFDNIPSPPIPSPFDSSMPPAYQSPSSPPFREPEQQYDTPNDPFRQSSFEQPQTPFGQQSAPYNAPMQQTEWTPPPAPEADWQNQNIGANTPFEPPHIHHGENQTFPIVSLVCGILAFVLICCYGGIPFGLAALILGFLGMQNVNKDPAKYGGKTLAIIGMALGGIAFVLNIILLIFGIAGGVLSNLQR